MASTYLSGRKSGDSGHTPVETPNNLLSTSSAKILLALGEGEWHGDINGRDIYLNGTPLLDSQGNVNFPGTKWDFRPGSVHQTYIQGIPSVENELSINTELTDASPWVRTVSNSMLSAVRIRLRWPSLQRQKDNGDIIGHTISYLIEVATDGGSYRTQLQTSVSGKTNTTYERSHRINLPPGSSWQVRVSRITPNQHKVTVADSMFIAAITEVVDAKFSYPNTALLYIEFDAEQFNNIPTVAVKAKMRKVRVPSNYDPIARKYSGMWDGSFKMAWSNNPAWISYDIILEDRFGTGQYIDASLVDKWELYQIAQYCDEPISDGKGGLEPRFLCDIYIQQSREAWQVLRDIAAIYRGMSYWANGQMYTVADMPRDMDFIYTNANVIDGKFIYTGTSVRSKFTRAIVSWDDPDNEYNTDVTSVGNFDLQQRFGDNPVELSAIGCTRESEAQRRGQWAIHTNNSDRMVGFSVGLDGQVPLPGMIIGVADKLIGGKRFGGRIKAVDGLKITLDQACDAAINDRLIINLPSGKAEKRTITAVNDAQITVSTAYSETPAEQLQWSVESSTLVPQLFRVMTIRKADSDEIEYQISAVEHNPAKFNAIDTGTKLLDRPVSVLPAKTQTAPVAVTINQRTYVEQTQSITVMIIDWTKTDGAVAYDVQWRKDDADWVPLPRTGSTSVEVVGVYTGNYLARVRAVNSVNVTSLFCESILTPLMGKSTGPDAPTSLSALGTPFGINLYWDFPPLSEDTLFTQIEIATDNTGSDAQHLVDVAYPGASYKVDNIPKGISYFFRARLIDKIGNQGIWTEWAKGTSSDLQSQYNALFDVLQIKDNQLTQELRSRIDLIDSTPIFGTENGLIGLFDNELSILYVTKQEAIDAKVEAVQASVDAINASADATTSRAEAMLAQSGAVNAKAQAIQAAGDALTAKTDAIIAQNEAVTAKVEAIAAANDAALDADHSAQSALDAASAADAAGVSMTSADGSAQAAAVAKADAAGSASAALASKTAAGTSASNAAASATTASNQASAALTAKTDAESARNAASASATAADTSAQAALTSKTAAASSATSASASATTATNQAAAALTAKTDAETAKNSASASATAAAGSASAALSSKTAAADSATSASASATTATNQASAALTAKTAAETAKEGAVAAQSSASASATAADSSAQAALASKTAAGTSASNAAASATTAADQASAALTAKTEAETARDDAETAKDDAQTAMSSASAFADASASSATAALASQTAAGNSASSASASATTATNQASAALTAKTAAETAKTGADSAKSAASASATAADTSAQAALSSKTAAANSATAAAASATTSSTQATAALTAKNEAVSAKDAALLAQNSASAFADAAEDSATAALASETAAGSSASAASASATTASDGAAAALSAKTGGETAKNSASASATAADTSAQAALTSKTAAANSATSASASATTATNQATAALASKNAAGTSETNAAASATAASGSASAALASKTAAADSATSASASATTATNQATAALTAKTAAETAKTDAETAMSSASAFADAAEDSATAALASETAAGDSASSASASATTATTQASAALSSKTAAASSATSASASATTAANEAAAALSSKTAAANSATSASASATTATNQASAALTAKTDAETAKNSASGFATAASDSAAAALTSKTAAGTSASNAAASATSAATQATAALTAKNEAVTAKDAAVTAQNSASAFADAAEDSATAALASETAAGNSASSASASATTATDQASAALASKTAAGTSETNAAASATSSATQAAAALASKNAAATSATAADGSKTAAANSATAAATSETNAAGSASAALTSKNAAASSATAADGSKTAAANSATAAATSATNAAGSASAALTSKNAAESSATAADGSKTAAANSASAAALSETNAAGSATAALSSKNAAASSATAADGSKTAAANSASAAVISETNAAGSASAALTSKNAASTSATNAAGSATTASTKASEASASATASSDSAAAALLSQNAAASSATAADGSKTAAANSASAAVVSETNAAGSASAALASKTAAANSATAADGSKTAAATSAASALQAKTDADGAASAAIAAKTQAQTSETNAAGSATTASTKAAEAVISAQTASTKATLAQQVSLRLNNLDNTYNKLDTRDWIIGTSGSQTGSDGNTWSINGAVAENRIISEIGPFGPTSVWECKSDGLNDASGGFLKTIAIDATKTYRFVMWYKRVDAIGSYYLGCSQTTTESLAGVANNNPYFFSGSGRPVPATEWFAIVGYVYAAGTATPLFTDDGVYDAAGRKLTTVTSYRAKAGATTQVMRAYLYYATTAGAKQYMAEPRIEVMDGTQIPFSRLFESTAATQVQLTAVQTRMTATENEAYYSLKVEANGKVAGFGATASPNGTEIYFNADKLAILPPSSSDVGLSVAPFVIDTVTGKTVISDALIKNLTAQNFVGGSITADSLAVTRYVNLPTSSIAEDMLDSSFLNSLMRIDPSAVTTGGTQTNQGTCISRTLTLAAIYSGGHTTKLRVYMPSVGLTGLGSKPQAPSLTVTLKRDGVTIASQVFSGYSFQPPSDPWEAGIYAVNWEVQDAGTTQGANHVYSAVLVVSDSRSLLSSSLLQFTASEPVGSNGGVSVQSLLFNGTNYFSVNSSGASVLEGDLYVGNFAKRIANSVGYVYDNGNRVYSASNTNLGAGATNYAAGNHTHSYLPLIGGTLTGTLTGTTFVGALTGNATTATTLATARTINGVSFNGSANITIADATKLPLTGGTLTGSVTGTTFIGALTGNATTATTLATARTINGVSFDGSTNITVADATKLPLTGGTLTGLLTGTTISATTFTGALSGNATTATALATARTINGVSFDGTANITVADSTKLPLTGGTLTGTLTGTTFVGALTGNASTATTLQTARTINGVSFNGSANITVADSTKLPLTGGTLTGTLTGTTFVGALSGNATTATTLATARTIGFSGITATAQSFNGSANITIPVTAVPTSLLTGTIADAQISGSYTGMTNLTGSGTVDFTKFLGNASDSVTSPSFSWTGDLDTGIYQPAADQLAISTGGVQRALFSSSGVTATTFIGALTGNASTATTLQTARTINGVSFNGSANITVADSTKLPLAGGTLTGTLTGTTFVGALSGNATSATTATNATSLGGVAATAYVRNDIDNNVAGCLISTGRNASMMGVYDIAKTAQIWSMGTSYRNAADGTNFGTLYGIAYKHTTNVTGGTMAGGHQMVWCVNGVGKAALGDGVWTSGTVTGSDCIATSDRRVKDDVAPITDPIGKLLLLSGNTFTRRDMQGRRHAGVIAQEVQQVFPEAIFETADESLGVKLNVSTSALIGLLVAAVKDQQRQITRMQRELTKLRTA